jgi:hypothetical protein
MSMSHFRSRVAGILAATSCSFVALRAFADEPNVCTDAYEQSQIQMKPRTGEGESSLLRARASLLTCMRSNCKDWMVADCSKWLTEVEARIPTVVFSARNTAGRDLTDVQVQKASGEPLATRLDGRAIELEPGEYVFVFVATDGTRVEKTALVREGEKAQSVVGMFEASPEELAKARGQGPAAPSGPGDSGRVESQPSTLHYVGYGAAGLGAVGLGIGTIFGITAINQKSNARCGDDNLCEDGSALNDAVSAAKVATVGFIAGGILVAGGVALLLFTPAKSVRVEARGAAMPGGALYGIGGTF